MAKSKKFDYKANAKNAVKEAIAKAFPENDVVDIAKVNVENLHMTQDTLVIKNVVVTNKAGEEFKTDVQIKLITPSATNGDSYNVTKEDEE